MSGVTDWGHSCEGGRTCTLHNLHCAYPRCEKGKADAARDGAERVARSEHPSPISEREIEAEVFDAAWSALQHSELIEIKTVRRKLSLHELRTFFQVVVPLVAKAALSQRCGRDEAIEEAAKVAENFGFYSTHRYAGKHIAARIRSLVSDDKERG